MRYLLCVLLLGSFTFSSFAQTHKHDHTKDHGAKSEAKSSSGINSELSSVLLINDSLFNSLLASDQAKVEQAAQALLKTINDSKTLNKLSSKIELSNISKSNSKDKNIEAYSKFLPELIAIVKKNKVEPSFQIYYCPMIKKEWIQNEITNKSVKNVFSQEMLECGGKA